ncbi:unnamed protein product [Rhizopus stolonifer]
MDKPNNFYCDSGTYHCYFKKRQIASYTAVANIIVTGQDSKGQNAASEIGKNTWILYFFVILLLLIN